MISDIDRTKSDHYRGYCKGLSFIVQAYQGFPQTSLHYCGNHNGRHSPPAKENFRVCRDRLVPLYGPTAVVLDRDEKQMTLIRFLPSSISAEGGKVALFLCDLNMAELTYTAVRHSWCQTFFGILSATSGYKHAVILS